MSENSVPRRGPGRPTNQRLRPAVLATVGALLSERDYDAVSMEEIAAHAGVSKQSLYRLWGSKVELVADAVLGGDYRLTAAPIATHGTVRDDLTGWLQATAAQLQQPGMASVVRALATASAGGPEKGEDFNRVLLAPVWGPVRDRLAHAKASGELPAHFSPETVVDLLVGYLIFVSIGQARLDPQRIDEIVEALLPAA